MTDVLAALLDLLRSPDGQPGDWYGWVTVFAAHALLVGGTLAAALLVCRLPQWIGALGYAVWEALQLLYGGEWIDGAVDMAAVVLGQALIWAAWRGRKRVAAAAMAAILAVAAFGVWRRK